jgi:uncharacterized zinc-type alcohol dehydrogenase-like protein
MPQVQGYGAREASAPLERMPVEVAEPRDGELEVEVLYCGVCHSDIHQVKNEWHNSVYPCVPGHEVVGRVRRAGAGVSRFKEGDLVGIGCMIDSCGRCAPCRAGEQNYCEGPNSWLATYNGPMVPRAKAPGGQNAYGRDNTFGGYAERLVVREEFALRIPPSLRPEHAAPLLCAGVTTWSPLRHWNVGPGSRVGIVGLGGLGHVAVKLARALGAEVTVFTHTPEKIAEAKEIGATAAVLESDPAAFGGLARQFDLILSTVPQKHDLGPYVPCLKHDGALVVVGALEPLPPLDNMSLAQARRTVGGSLIGSLAETQEVLDFCAEHGIAPEVQLIRADEINAAFDRVEKSEVRFRYVIDGRSIGTPAPVGRH